MYLTEEKIKSFSSAEYLQYRKEIKKFYKALRPSRPRKIRTNYQKSKKLKIKLHVKFAYCRLCLDYKKITLFPLSSRYCYECVNLNKKVRYYTDINYKLASILRNRLNTVLKVNLPTQHTKDFLGCTLEEFRIYIENQFKPGMTWENHGVHGWHIDHIKPCASFDLSKPEEQAKCFHYSNLQPLWAEENLRKNGKY